MNVSMPDFGIRTALTPGDLCEGNSPSWINFRTLAVGIPKIFAVCATENMI